MIVDNQKAGIGVGAAAGLTAGTVVGTIKANKIKAPYKEFLKYGSEDEFIKQKVHGDYTTKLLEEVTKGKRKTDEFPALIKDKVAATREEYKKISADLPGALKNAKKVKTKWMAGLLAAGALLGGAAVFIGKKAKNAQEIHTEKSKVKHQKLAEKLQSKQEKAAAQKLAMEKKIEAEKRK